MKQKENMKIKKKNIFLKRSKMLYKDYLKKLKKCPLCDLMKEEILKSNKSALIILPRAPFTKNHLIVIPKKHRLRMSDLNKNEKKDESGRL